MKTKMLSRHVMAGANGTLSVVALLGPLVDAVGFGLRLELEVIDNTKVRLCMRITLVLFS